MSKRFDGRNEVIIEPSLPIIDAHHHLFDKPGMRYMTEEFLEDVRAGHNVVASVYIEASAFHRRSGPPVLRPLGEIEFANGVGAMFASGEYGDLRLCAGIVGYADFRMGDEVALLLDRAMEAAPDRFRGIRQITMEHPSDAPFKYFFTGRPPAGVFEHPRFREGFTQLAKRGLSFDATGFHLQLPDIDKLADAFPYTTLIVNHMTVAMGLDMTDCERHELFLDWSSALRETAKRQNVVCKIGGMGMPIWGFGFDESNSPVSSVELARSWTPFVETAIDAFGVDRCMLESNYPPDARSCGYVPIWNALKLCTSGASDTEKAALFHRTAAQIYRLDLPSSVLSVGP